MASFTLRRPDVFPPGTTVHLFRFAGSGGQDGRPPGDELDALVIAADGTTTFENLGDNLRYVIWGVVNGDNRYVRFTTPAGVLSAPGGGGGGGGPVVIPGGLFRSDWLPNTDYRLGDIVINPSDTAMFATQPHSSTSDYQADEDAGLWQPVNFAQNALTAGLLGQPNGVAQLDQAGVVRASQLPASQNIKYGQETFTRRGVLTVGAGVGRWVPGFPGTLQGWHAWLSKAPDGQDAIINLLKNGVIVAAAVITKNTLTSSLVTPTPQPFNAFDVFTVDRQQVGTQPMGGPLTPTLRFDQSDAAATGVTTLTVARPAGVQVGDWHLLTLRGGNSDMNTPTGWQKVGLHLSSGTGATDFYWRMDDGTATSWDFTSATAMSSVFANHQVYSGVDPVAPVDATQTLVFGTTNTLTPNGITSTSNNALIGNALWLGATRAAAAPTGYTARSGFSGTSGTAVRRHLADKIQATPGAADTNTMAIGGAGSNGVLLRFALKPYIVPPQAVWSPGEDLGAMVQYLRS